jgi:uncharacterized DUF497 family protein
MHRKARVPPRSEHLDALGGRGVIFKEHFENLLAEDSLQRLALSCYWQYHNIMNEITFSWDDRKDKENQRKHGVSFEESVTAFADENARLKHDPDHSQKEDRFLLLGCSQKLRLLVVVHVYKKDEKEIRIISARRATKNEHRQYGKFL